MEPSVPERVVLKCIDLRCCNIAGNDGACAAEFDKASVVAEGADGPNVPAINFAKHGRACCPPPPPNDPRVVFAFAPCKDVDRGGAVLIEGPEMVELGVEFPRPEDRSLSVLSREPLVVCSNPLS